MSSYVNQNHCAGARREIDSGLVLPGGDLGAFTQQTLLSQPRAGAAAFVGSNELVIYGGRVGGADSSGQSAEIDASGNTGNWNSLPEQLVRERIYAAAVQEGVLLYVLGGADPGDSPLAAVEQTAR